MGKVRVLFCAADPLSAPPHYGQKLSLDAEAREIEEKVNAATHRDLVEMRSCWATRTGDLLRALYSAPHVVHFSGHGGSDGLVLVSADGKDAQHVDAASLARLFQAFPGNTRLVLLNACFSLPQARAIADVVGCAIGTPRTIGDEAAITFAAAFYSAIAFGQSVRAAYDQASAALALERFDERQWPQIVTRADVDPAKIVLVTCGAAEPAPAAPGTLELPEPALGTTEPASNDSSGRGPSLTGLAGARRWAAMAVTAATLVAGGALLVNPGPPGVGVPVGSADSTAADTTVRGLGNFGPPDFETAKKLYEAGDYARALPGIEYAAESTARTEAMALLGIMYMEGQGTRPRPSIGMEWLRKAAYKRDPRAMNALGEAYEEGHGASQPFRWALHWYRAAAREKGYAPAMINLGDMHREGLGKGGVNYDSALIWYRAAMDSGAVDAIALVGRIHEEGSARYRDAARAFRLYRAAADSGSALGMFSVGRAYQRGAIVRQDYGEARRWYMKAAENGSADAMNALGELYRNGWGVVANREEAIHWFRRAADAGSAVAQANLAALGAR